VQSPFRASDPNPPDREIIHLDTAFEQAETQIPAVAEGLVSGSLKPENIRCGNRYNPETGFSVIL
jgi:hypothetical protein